MSAIAPNQPSSTGTADARVRYETEDGTEYVVLPVTAQTEGIYKYPTTNGGTTREYVDGEELTAPLDEWEGVPTLLRHPIVNDGGDVAHGLTTNPSAQYVEIGDFRSVDRSTDTKLRGEAWIPAPEVGSHGGDLEGYIETIEAGGFGEVSTGYGTRSIEPTSGRYNGASYDAEQVGIQPDHLAILPDATGNCPVSGGECGAGRLNDRTESAVRANAARITSEGDHDMRHTLTDTDEQDLENIDLDAEDVTRLHRAWSTVATIVPGLPRINQSAGDAVRWESDAGGSVTVDGTSYRYGVVVDDYQDGPDDEVMVAVYEPGSDGWENRGEENPMQEDALEEVGNDGVGSLPPISSVTNAAGAEPDDPADGEASGEVSAGGSDTSSSDEDETETEQGGDEPAESGAEDDDTQTMTDKTETLVEEHGFDAENLPDEEEECFDRIYDAFAGDGEGEDVATDGGESGGESTETETAEGTETTDSPEGPDGTEGGEEVTVNLGDHDSVEEFLDAKVEERFNEREQTLERSEQEREILNTDAPFDEEDLEAMNNEGVARVHEKFVDEEDTPERPTVNMAGYPGEVDRTNSDDSPVSPGGYGNWAANKEGDD